MRNISYGLNVNCNKVRMSSSCKRLSFTIYNLLTVIWYYAAISRSAFITRNITSINGNVPQTRNLLRRFPLQVYFPLSLAFHTRYPGHIQGVQKFGHMKMLTSKNSIHEIGLGNLRYGCHISIHIGFTIMTLNYYKFYKMFCQVLWWLLQFLRLMILETHKKINLFKNCNKNTNWTFSL